MLVFGMLQRRTAELLGLRASVVLAAQNGGGAIGSVVSSAKLLVGASTVKMGGREGEILRASAAVIVMLLVLVSLIAWLLLRLGWG